MKQLTYKTWRKISFLRDEYFLHFMSPEAAAGDAEKLKGFTPTTGTIDEARDKLADAEAEGIDEIYAGNPPDFMTAKAHLESYFTGEKKSD